MTDAEYKAMCDDSAKRGKRIVWAMVVLIVVVLVVGLSGLH